MRSIVASALAASLLAAPGVAAAELASLAGSEWGFHDLKDVYVQFRSDGKVRGFAGCNRFMGAYAEGKGALRIGPLATTRMMCKPSAMQVEQHILKILAETRQVKATHLVLTLEDDAGRVLATLERRDFD
ncbi:MAG: META domain-containing protein [Hyphomicrobiales bacterium]